MCLRLKNLNIITNEIHGCLEILLVVELGTAVLHLISAPGVIKNCVGIFCFLFRKFTQGFASQVTKLFHMSENNVDLVGNTDLELLLQEKEILLESG